MTAICVCDVPSDQRNTVRLYRRRAEILDGRWTFAAIGVARLRAAENATGFRINPLPCTPSGRLRVLLAKVLLRPELPKLHTRVRFPSPAPKN
jgi:hypothetical protein